MLGSTLWDPLIEEKRAQNYFFRWERDRLKLNLKPQIISRYREDQGILYEEGRLSAELQSLDLDEVNLDYLDKLEIMDPVPEGSVVGFSSIVLIFNCGTQGGESP